MAKVSPGRYTAEIDGEFCVFLIGMRFNRLWKVHKWLPVFLSMPAMLRELLSHPDKGLLGMRTMWAGRTVTLVQYWRSFEQLERFARDPSDPHLAAWRRFNAAVGSGGDVGVYHETFRVAPGAYECLYGNMPPMGLAAAGRHVPVGARSETAAQRIGKAAN